MIIGIPKEIKNNENRVSLTPSGAKELTKRGHKVYVQATAGANSGFPDKDYVAAGAELLPTIEEVYAKAEMIIKVKEPIEPEYKLIRQGQLVFTYFHFASSEPLTRAMVESGAICCAYETVEASDRSLPLLIPMSEVAGRMATQEYNIREELKTADLVIGSVLIPGAKAPKLVTRDMLKDMEPGSVLVDVAIDQGGCFETSRPTTHEKPTYFVDGILHYCVANIPGAVPYTSTLGLTNATLPYAIQLADKGWRRACKENHELELGLNVVEGKVVYKQVADAWGLQYEPLAL